MCKGSGTVSEIVVAPGESMDEAWNELDGFIAKLVITIRLTK